MNRRIAMNSMFFVNSIMLGVGLAMDAFCVSLANGLNDPQIKLPWICGIAAVFGAFQAFMPMTGWLCVHTIVEYFRAFEKFIPWIALILLALIGGKMIIEGIRGKDEEEKIIKLTGAALMIQGIATSIDALSVGFAIAEYTTVMALFSSLIIGVVTFIISTAGVVTGKRFGTKIAGRATIVGGIILVLIGIEIAVTGIF